MYKRLICPSRGQSYFLLGPRGVGKSSFVRQAYKKALVFDLLASDVYTRFLAAPHALGDYIPSSFKGFVVIDEIQKIPALLNEVHRLIEGRKLKFILTGSSARKLKSKNVNLLAGRALTEHMYPLTAQELGDNFNLKKSLAYGHLPMAYASKQPKKFLKSYVHTYLTEEVQHEGLARSLPDFSRFLEAASFSQASVLNVSNVARECAVPRKVVESYFSILKDTLLAYELKVFRKKSKRPLLKHNKFYFFDVGVFQALRPRGPLDEAPVAGVILESLVMQELMAHNSYNQNECELYYWRTQNHKHEVDFVLYGPKTFKVLEVKSSARLRPEDFKSLIEFKKDYPTAKAFMLYLGARTYVYKNIKVVPVVKFLKSISKFI